MAPKRRVNGPNSVMYAAKSHGPSTGENLGFSRVMVRDEKDKSNVSESKLRRFERPATIKEHVYNTLREQLLHNKYKPNARLVEKQITEQLGVSRTPVREALSSLASDGLLVATKHGY